MNQKVDNLVAASLMFFASAVASAKQLDCYSQATGAQVSVLDQRNTDETYLQMNNEMRNRLRQQGAKSKIPFLGTTNWNAENFQFANYTLELRLKSHHGGMMLTWDIARQDHEVIVERASFYFHPGECRFHF